MTIDLKERFKKKRAPLKADEIVEAGYNYKEILELEKNGEIKRFKNGYYICPEVELNEEEIVIGLFPDGVFTMETALFYHGYLKQQPFIWSVAITKNVSKSRFKMDYPIVHPYYSEPFVLKEGVCQMDTAFGKISLYDKDRIICEVLKYEEKMDHGDYKEALKAYIADPEKNPRRFLEFAKSRRVIRKARAIVGPWL